MFSPNVIGAGAVGAWHANQARYYPRGGGGGGQPGGDDAASVIGGLIFLAAIAGVVLYFLC